MRNYTLKVLATPVLLAIAMTAQRTHRLRSCHSSISGLVVEYIVAIDVTRVRFPADALSNDAWAPMQAPLPCCSGTELVQIKQQGASAASSSAHALRHIKHMVPRGLEPQTLRLLAVRSNQLSYETIE